MHKSFLWRFYKGWIQHFIGGSFRENNQIKETIYESGSMDIVINVFNTKVLCTQTFIASWLRPGLLDVCKGNQKSLPLSDFCTHLEPLQKKKRWTLCLSIFCSLYISWCWCLIKPLNFICLFFCTNQPLEDSTLLVTISVRKDPCLSISFCRVLNFSAYKSFSKDRWSAIFSFFTLPLLPLFPFLLSEFFFLFFSRRNPSSAALPLLHSMRGRITLCPTNFSYGVLKNEFCKWWRAESAEALEMNSTDRKYCA